jgi:hypothetical protein
MAAETSTCRKQMNIMFSLLQRQRWFRCTYVLVAKRRIREVRGKKKKTMKEEKYIFDRL